MTRPPPEASFCTMPPAPTVSGAAPISTPPPPTPPPPPPPRPPGEHAVAATSVTAARAAYHRAQCLIPTSVEVRNCDEITRSKGLRQRRGFNRPAEARQAADWGLGSEAVIQANLDAPRASRREVEFGHRRRPRPAGARSWRIALRSTQRRADCPASRPIAPALSAKWRTAPLSCSHER